jgi:hypothetical protein
LQLAEPLHTAFCPVGERSGTSPDDLTKREAAKIAKLSPHAENKKMPRRANKEKYGSEPEQQKRREPVTPFLWGKQGITYLETLCRPPPLPVDPVQPWCNPCRFYGKNQPERRFYPYIWDKVDSIDTIYRGRPNFRQLRISRLGVRVPPGTLKWNTPVMGCFNLQMRCYF